MSDPTRTAAALDAADPLAHLRSEFVGADSDLAYLDGNSLGRPLRSSADRLAGFVEQQWGGRLIRGWDEQWMELPLALGDRIGQVLLGAASGQTVVADSTSVLLYKLIRAAVDHQADVDAMRREIVVDIANFPTDRYLVEGIAAERGLYVRWLTPDPEVTPEAVAALVDQHTAAVLLSHVSYQSGHVVDVPTIAELAHDAGALLVLDACHSVGALPLAFDDWGVDLAAGCTYKYLNGGPGSPAFAYVATRHQEVLTQPLQGWMGHAEPFVMGPGYRPAPGMRRFLTGTPPILAMQPLSDMVELIASVGIEAVRSKGIALTSYAVELADTLLSPYDVSVASPRDPHQRGNHVMFIHPQMRKVVAALWERNVIPDFREPDGLRVGLSPLSTSFAEVEVGIRAIADLLA